MVASPSRACCTLAYGEKGDSFSRQRSEDKGPRSRAALDLRLYVHTVQGGESWGGRLLLIPSLRRLLGPSNGGVIA
jgi:hypothetical protein